MTRSILLLFCVLPIVLSQETNFREVTITQGKVRGYKTPNENIFVFYGIPYASVPTGADFYKSPLPAPTWSTTLEAVNRDIRCRQPSFSGNDNMREQCLVANVYVPGTQTENLPVVVDVHGGAYLLGHGNAATPINLVKSQKVMYVTFNYRLGPHGFLCLGTDKVPGNAGMKDQVALLRWVRDNIAQFGGDPNHVTISGCSAGSSSVDLLGISKLANGLFHKVIAGSGGNVNAFSVQTNPIENAQYFAKLLGFNNTEDINALEKFYLETPYETLAATSIQLMSSPDSNVYFSPCLEKDVGQEMFLDESPVKILSNGDYTKLPMLYGFCNMEGLFRMNLFDTWKTKMNENFIEFLPPDLGNNQEERETIAKDVKNFYFGTEPVSNSTVLKYIDYFTDVMFGYAMLRSAKLQLDAGNNQLYLYEYSFVDASEEYIPNTRERGATHCAQDAAVMDSPNEKELSTEYKNMKAAMRQLWLNFITTGAPVPQGSTFPNWTSMSPQRSYMSLNSVLQYKDSLMPDRAQFWDGIMAKYYKYPSPPDPKNGSSALISNSVSPLPAPTWSTTLEAVNRDIRCRQPSFSGNDNMREQCLVANVYVPGTQTENLPVVVDVHGGAYLLGHGNAATPINLVKSQKVMYVTFNYRLGPHGFLCLGTDKVPGNAGMKDQVALLRWVRDNIAQFGGDPNHVTISGCSAGSSSVDLLGISKLANGLFHKVIAGSGGNVNAFSVQTNPIENAQYFAKLLGFNNTEDINALEKFYLETPYETLAATSIQLMSSPDSNVYFSPCLEKDVGQEMFLDESPVKILSNGDYTKLPMLYGFCNMEGLFRMNLFDTWKTKMNENFIEFLPPDLGNNQEERETIAKDVKNFYFGTEPVSNSTVLKYIDYFTDVMFGYAMLRSAKLQLDAGNNQLYLYEYSFVDASEEYIPNTRERGATHCAQDAAVMDSPNEKELSTEYKNMKAAMRQLWLNFITTGAPVPQGSTFPNWTSMSPQRSYMSLNSVLQYKDSLMPDRAQFWDGIMAKYYKYPSPPDPKNGSSALISNSVVSLILMTLYSIHSCLY
ncbi:unnamed protein product [Leptosia nina]|uniref:Carboxylesterase type B domain-containing protein n=1 Tax=Leptosia nina TaxID=320188 RepID=A0AAV1IZR1_9NEOP